MPFELPRLASLGRRLLLDRNGQRVTLIRNYPLQYVVGGSIFVLAGVVVVAVGNAVGLRLIAFGLIGYAFAGVYYKFL